MVCAGGCAEWWVGGSGTAEGRHNARQRQGQGRFGDWGALSPGHPHTAGRETGRDAAAQVETVASRTADAKAGAGTERGRGAVDNSRADRASVEGKRPREGGRGKGGETGVGVGDSKG